VLFEDYAEKWLRSKARRRFNTVRTYRSTLNARINPYIGMKQVAHCLPSDMSDVVAGYMEEELSGSPNTEAMIIYCLKGVFNLAVADNIIMKNPAMEMKRNMEDFAPRRALTEAEESATLKYIQNHPGTLESLFLLMLFFTGCREGEACGPQWVHMDFQRDIVKVDQQLVYCKGGGEISKLLKTKNSRREIPMPAQMKNILLPYRGLPNVYMFNKDGKHIQYGRIRAMWLNIIAEEPALAEITPHYFRHNFATRLYKAGVQNMVAARIMGETPQVMQKVYTHLENEYGMQADSCARKVFDDVAIL